MLSDRDLRALLEIERRFEAEDPDFTRVFSTSEHPRTSSHGVSQWMYAGTSGFALALSGLMVLAGLWVGGLVFAAAAWGIWRLRDTSEPPARAVRADRWRLRGRRNPGRHAAGTPVPTPRAAVGCRSDDRAAIVVGVDGSACGGDALDWAVAEALAQRQPLRIVLAYNPPVMDGPLGPTPGGVLGGALQAAANRALDKAVAQARCAGPDLEVQGRLVAGAATPALLEQAQDARLLVVGSRSVSGFANLLGGSLGVEVVSEARCPVVVIRPRPDQRRGPSGGRVVVGVDHQGLSSPAIRFAFDTAVRRGVGVTAVHAWSPQIASYAGCHLAPVLAEVYEEQEQRQQLLLQALLSARRDSPDLDVRVKVVRGSPGQALVDESSGAELVVVGSRGVRRGSLLGSVSHKLLRHAQCPVAVVRADPTPHRPEGQCP